jgi:hypothetical protein
MANDESDALDVLEKEAKEYNKVRKGKPSLFQLADFSTRMPRLIESSKRLNLIRKFLDLSNSASGH